MDKKNMQDAYTYLNSLDEYRSALIPKEAWTCFEKQLGENSKNKLPQEIEDKEKIKKFITFIEQTYLFF